MSDGCAHLGCTTPAPQGRLCWPCWSAAKDRRPCPCESRHAAFARRASTGILSAYNRVGRSDPGWA